MSLRKKSFSVIFTICILSMAAVQAMAYRVIQTPTADVLEPGDLRLEGQTQNLDKDSAHLYRLDLGLQGSFERSLELQVSYYDRSQSSATTEVGLEKQVIPETTLIPAIAVGVQDLTNTSGTGRTFYAAASKMVPLSDTLPLPIHDIHLNAGIGNGYYSGPFMGASAKLPLGLGVEAENDNHGFNYGASWQLGGMLKLRAMSIHGDRVYSVVFSPTKIL